MIGREKIEIQDVLIHPLIIHSINADHDFYDLVTLFDN